MNFLGYALRLFVVMMFSALGTSMAFAVPLATSEITLSQTENLHISQTADVGFAVRAPPLAVANVATTGDVTVMNGGAFVMQEQVTTVAVRGFVSDLNAPNRTATRVEFDQSYSGRFGSQAEADEAFKQYELVKNSDAEVVLGRLDATAAGGELGLTRLDSNNWTPNVNDAFVQGGIDAGKPFYLGSNPNISNFRATAEFDSAGNFVGRGDFPETVFLREMRQLRDAGYKLEGDYMVPGQ